MLTSLIGVDWEMGVSVGVTTRGGVPVCWGAGFTHSSSWSKFRLGRLSDLSHCSCRMSLMYSSTFCFSATGFGYAARCADNSWLGLTGIVSTSRSGSCSCFEACVDAFFFGFLSLTRSRGEALVVTL